MTTSLVLTVIGPDKPGLVELLSNTVADHQGNWSESSMSRLAGKFAGILTVTVPADQASALIDALNALDDQGLKVNAEVSQEPATVNSHKEMTLELVGHDKAGIVRDISQALAKRQINVERLSTELVSGSMSAEELFKAQAEILAPSNTDLDELQEALESIASDLMVDITLK